MSKFLVKIIPAIITWGIVVLVILQVPYTNNITQASFTQTLSFFIPLFLAFVLTFNIFLKNILLSSSITLGIILLLILKALDSLNLITGSLIFIAVGLLVSYFRKAKRRSLTSLPKIPTLTKFGKQ